MKEFCVPNVFSKCGFEELTTLYEETKRYNHFADIPETSPLYKYMEKFFKSSPYKSISVFYLQLTRAYIDCSSIYPETPLAGVSDTNTDFKKLLDKRIQEKHKCGRV